MSTKTKQNENATKIDAAKLSAALRVSTQVKAGVPDTGSWFPYPTGPRRCQVCGQG